MATTELQQEINRYASALGLNRIFPFVFRRFLIRTLVFLLVLLIGFLVLEYIIRVAFGIFESSGIFSLFVYSTYVQGVLFITLGAGFILLMLESFYNTFYFQGFSDTHKKGTAGIQGITYEVADILSYSQNDLTKAFYFSVYGKEILLRCGLDPKASVTFLQTPEREFITSNVVQLPKEGFVTLALFARTLFEHDKAFEKFLFQKGISKEIFYGATDWVLRSLYHNKARVRWWGRDNLMRTEGIGKDWGYGGAYELTRFAKPLYEGSVFSALLTESSFAYDKVKQLETILARAKEANALLVGEEGVGKRDVLIALQQKITYEEVLPSLQNRRMLALDTNAFIATYGDKQSFEQAFLKLLSQATHAGNIILVIEDLTAFIKSAEALGSDVVAGLDPYLSSTNLQVLATSDPVSFHEVIEARPQLVQRFEVVQIEGADYSSTLAVLEDVAERYEKQNNVQFTYDALTTIIEGAERYLVGGVLLDKAVDLIVELLPVAASEKTSFITKTFVEKYIKEKTGIPIGDITDKEREVLLNLEQILHKRVVGQDEAIATISNAMRRARAGIQNPDRPIGSFLFLGPTGVGKTETTKALAEVFFGDEDNMLRLDMSEYSSDDALNRLIGSSDSEHVGDLVTLLKEHPHGVLLLDEFEKTDSGVMDLFLQILDEGFFTSARGERISTRNVIIIATSNAGSTLIWEFTKAGRTLSDVKDEIIDSIIKDGIYKPELVNRFDSVVLFHTLSEEHLEKISRLMLAILAKRIKKQGYKLVINDILVKKLATEGFNPQFGARPMRRIMQDSIEKLIAEKIIEGALKPGASIEFTEEDFEN